jgi:hypothetical protein
MISIYEKNISIQLVDFQIENYKIVECADWKDFDIKWHNNEKNPVCIGTELESIKEKKYDILKFNNIEVSEPDSKREPWGLMDYLFLENFNIPYANTITLINQKNQKSLKNLKSMLKMAKSNRCKTFNITCDNDYSDTIFKFISQLISEAYAEYKITRSINNVELVDAGTKQMNINVYFSTGDLVGVTSFIYQTKKASVFTSLFTRSYALENPDSKINKNLFYYEYIQILCAGILAVQLYLKYLKIRSIKETLNNSFFFVMFLVFFLFEYTFKLHHYFKSTNDYIFPENFISSPNQRELLPYFLENIKIIKSFSTVSLSYHLIYVVFDIKYLIVFTSFLKPVFQRFLIVLCLIILSISLMIMLISGPFYIEFSSFSLAFFNVLNYVFGIDSPSVTDASTFTIATTQTRFYFQVLLYAFRIIVVNFCLIIMFHLYRKNDLKKIKENKK